MSAGSMPYPDIFKPISLGKHRSRNRIVAIPHGQSTLTVAELHKNLGEMARLSVGMMVIGGAVIQDSSFRRRPQQLLPIFNKAFTRQLERVVQAVHDGGALLVSQLLHLGLEIWPLVEEYHPIWTPSAMPFPAHGGYSRAFDKKDLKRLRASHISCAANLADVGFDGYEIHSAHNYLMHQFLMPSRNQRTDEYGGSLENRSRIIREILIDLREKFPEKIVGIRLPAGGMPTDGLTESEILDLADQFSTANLIDYVTISVPSRPHRYVRDESFPAGGVRDFTRIVKSRVKCAVNVTQRIDTPALAQDILSSGDADLVGIGRSFLADQAWVEKARLGKADQIRPCIRCLEDCRIYRSQRWVSCIVNPTALGRALAPVRAIDKKRVVVVGGGPAGCEAALSAANAGAAVTLFEASGELGGRVRLAGKAPYRTTWLDYADYLHRQLTQHRSITVKLKRAATTQDIQAQKPDFVVLALGANQILEGTDGNTMTSDAFLAGSIPPWKRVVVVDELGRWDAINVAELLVAAGRSVVYVTPFERAANRIPEESRDFIFSRLQQGGVEFFLRHTLIETDAGYSVQENGLSGFKPLQGVEGVVRCGVLKPAADPQDIEKSNFQIFRIGDCLTPRGLSLACREGAAIGSRLLT